MDNKKGIKKNVDDRVNERENSSSSMVSSQRQNEETGNEVERAIKKTKKTTDESSNPPSQVQTSTVQVSSSRVKEASINDLPPEILTSILKCVEDKSLFKCRRVNRQWCQISSGLLCTRPKVTIIFKFENLQFSLFSMFSMFSMDGRKKKTKSLSDFLKCMKASKNCPYAQFYFFIHCHSTPSEFFDHEDLKELILDFVTLNPRMKFLGLHFKKTPLVLVPEKLRELLYNKIPNLEQLFLVFEREPGSWEPKIRLFPIQSSNKKNSRGAKIPVRFQLPHLKEIHFGPYMFSNYPEISKDLLNAAVNLKKIHGDNPNFVPSFLDPFLLSLEKPYLVQKVQLCINEGLLSTIRKHETGAIKLPMLKFEELELSMDKKMYGKDSNACVGGGAANFVSNFLGRNKDTLRGLKIKPIGLLTGLQLPQFKTLRRLKFEQPSAMFDSSSDLLHLLPSGVRSLDNFPLVTSLKFEMKDWPAGFPKEDCIPILPRVETVQVDPVRLNVASISILALMCPNLKHLKIQKGAYRTNEPDFGQVGRAIWTHMKQLETLYVDIDVDLEANNPIALDSCFTGISVENCQRLYEVTEALKALKKWSYQIKIPESELMTDREYPSILDMKDLKKLAINPYLKSYSMNRKEFFAKNVTWISQEYAFKLLPHLKPTEDDEEKDDDDGEELEEEDNDDGEEEAEEEEEDVDDEDNYEDVEEEDDEDV